MYCTKYLTFQSNYGIFKQKGVMAMKKKTFRVIALMLAFALTIPYASAYEGNDAEAILLSYYPEEIIEAMDPEYKDSLIEALLENPESVHTTTVIMEVDTLKEIESLVKMTDAELLAAGVDQASIDHARARINELCEGTPSEIKAKYGFSEVETKLIRQAAENAKQDIQTTNKTGVNTSGTIASSTMKFTTTAINQPKSGYPINYFGNCTYSWVKPFYVDIFRDKIAVSWGGDLLEYGIVGNATYRTVATAQAWGSTYGATRAMTLDGEVSNENFYVSFPQRGSITTLTSKGTLNFWLRSTTNQGKEAYIIARYGHQIATVNGVGLTIGYPSINFGSSYDQTPLNIGVGKVLISY